MRGDARDPDPKTSKEMQRYGWCKGYSRIDWTWGSGDRGRCLRMPQGVPMHLPCCRYWGCCGRPATTASVNASHLRYQLPAEASQWLRIASTAISITVLLQTMGVLKLICHVIIGHFNNILLGKPELSWICLSNSFIECIFCTRHSFRSSSWELIF